MPLKLIPPRAGRSKNYRVRGAYLGRYVDQSTGTHEKRLAEKALRDIRGQIECGAFAQRGDPTFLSAAVAYMEAGREGRYLNRAVKHFGETPLKRIDQAAIEAGAARCLPLASAATRNRHFYTPVSAVLKHAGMDFKIRRLPGAGGAERTVWLEPPQAYRLFDAARALDPGFGCFVVLLCYTGMRLSEGLDLTCDRVQLAAGYAYLPTTKNDEPRGVHLPAYVVAELANLPGGLDRGPEPVFGFRATKAAKLLKAALRAARVALPRRLAFHVCRHTYGAWMRRYANMDDVGMIATGVWKDHRSVKRYAHADTTAEARKADLLPTPTRVKSVESA